MPKPVRRTQAISPFGIGAMVDFPGPVSMIHCGLDAWPFDQRNPEHREFMIEDEERLARRLGVRFFVQPPDFRFVRKGLTSDEPNLNLKLPFLRFPRWHICPRCGLMHEAELHDKQAPACEGPVATGKDKGKRHPRRKAIQVRFVAACAHGHLQDFPWWEWVFQNNDPDQSGFRLRMHTSGSASLAGVRIVCEEDRYDKIQQVKSRSLAGAFAVTGAESVLSRLGIYCQGHNPALGIPSAQYAPPGCGNDLHLLLRGGSNVYFSHVISSIYIPTIDTTVDEEVLAILDDHHVYQFLEMMAQSSPDSIVSEAHAKSVLDKYYPSAEVSPNDLAKAVNNKIKGKNTSNTITVDADSDEQAYRREEYDLFKRDVNEGYPKTNLMISSQKIDSYEPIISDYFQRISLIHKLRETRAFTGFSRIFPDNTLDRDKRRELISRKQMDWLPATVVRGEGIFLQLREDKIQQWLDSNSGFLGKRITLMQNMVDQAREQRHQEYRPISPRFVMMHTFAHVLINQLIYDCGYGSASLRERLYGADGDRPMAGILIYTAAGDSEGTMGGLVRMGIPGRLENVLRHALENSRWCSSDPVCIESTGQGPDNCNLAACHSCALLPETSCEEGNRLLDRAMMVGSLEQQDIGFFS